ncbi:MAG: hypothetical protein ABI321_19960 [Polyangia bacterium]
MRLVAVALLLSACGAHHDSFDLGVADLSVGDQASITCASIGFDQAPLVSSTFIAGDAPTLSGGTLLDGTYVLSSYTYYGQDLDLMPATTQARGQFRVTAPTWAGAIELDGIQTVSAGFIKVVGNQLVLSNCAEKFPRNTTFAATSTTLTQLGAPTTTAQAVVGFTKQ